MADATRPMPLPTTVALSEARLSLSAALDLVDYKDDPNVDPAMLIEGVKGQAERVLRILAGVA